MRRVRRIMAGVIGTVLTAGLLGASGAVAADPPGQPFTVEAALWSRCLTGDAGSVPLTNGEKVKVIHKRGRAVVGRRTVTVSFGFRYCDAALVRPGDRYVITHIQDTRTIVIPKLGGTLSSTSLEVRTPATYSEFELVIARYITGFNPLSSFTNVPADGDGVTDLNVTVTGGDRATVRIHAPEGDWFSRTWISPYLTASVGSSRVVGAGRAGTTETIRLKSPGGALRGALKQKGALGTGALGGTLRKAGVAIKAHAGDTITSTAIPGDSLVLRATDLAVDATGSGTATGTCAEGTDFMVTVNGSIYNWGATPPDGQISVSPLIGGSGPVPSGTKVMLGCVDDNGFGQTTRVVVP